MLRGFCSCRHARSRACLPCWSKAPEPQPGLRLSKTQTRGRDCAARKAWGRPCPSLPPPLRSGLFVPSNTREKHVCHTKAAKNSSTLTARLQRRTAHVRASGALHQADGQWARQSAFVFFHLITTAFAFVVRGLKPLQIPPCRTFPVLLMRITTLAY